MSPACLKRLSVEGRADGVAREEGTLQVTEGAPDRWSPRGPEASTSGPGCPRSLANRQWTIRDYGSAQGRMLLKADTCGGKVLLLSGLKGVSVCVLVHQSCPTLCNPVHCSLPGSSVRGILQARILGWLAISFSRGSS